MSLPYPREQVTGLVLAGGRGERMGGCDKGLLEVGGHTMVEHVAARLRPQVSHLLVSANRNQQTYAELCGAKVIGDPIGEFPGPLAGMAAGLERCDGRYLLTAPCDSPLLAPDLGERLHHALIDEDAEIAVAHDGARMQPVFALLARELLDSCRAYLDAGERKLDRWYARHRLAQADLSGRGECFLNVNRPQDRAEVEAALER